jgi:hypothetical protein
MRAAERESGSDTKYPPVDAHTRKRDTMSKISRSTKSGELSTAPANDSSEQTDPGPRELAHRSNHGLEVTLLWHPALDELTVSGSDHLTGARFKIRPERHVALDAYYHPYSYVTESDISYEDHRLVEPSTSPGA